MIKNKDIALDIGKAIKVMRIKSGSKSYEKFAVDNSLSKIQYFKMEKGTNFTLNSLLKILEVHDIDFYTFIAKVKKNKD